MQPVSTPCSGQTGGPTGLCCGLAAEVARQQRGARGIDQRQQRVQRPIGVPQRIGAECLLALFGAMHLAVEPDIAAVAVGEERRRELRVIERARHDRALRLVPPVTRMPSSALAHVPRAAVHRTVEIPARRLGASASRAPFTSTAEMPVLIRIGWPPASSKKKATLSLLPLIDVAPSGARLAVVAEELHAIRAARHLHRKMDVAALGPAIAPAGCR
jgi:hypothetical protein